MCPGVYELLVHVLLMCPGVYELLVHVLLMCPGVYELLVHVLLMGPGVHELRHMDQQLIYSWQPLEMHGFTRLLTSMNLIMCPSYW